GITACCCPASREGFCPGMSKTTAICPYPSTGFNPHGKPAWGPATVSPIPNSIKPLTRIVYLPESDTMIPARGRPVGTDWTAIGTRIEVYHGWLAGNTAAPNPVIGLSSSNPKSITAAGNYLFVGYVHRQPNIDAFNLSTAALAAT
ncbi:SMP-30/gluconolaconase/LRE-like region family protein, partial [Burkholderia pseudomallei]